MPTPSGRCLGLMFNLLETTWARGPTQRTGAPRRLQRRARSRREPSSRASSLPSCLTQSPPNCRDALGGLEPSRDHCGLSAGPPGSPGDFLHASSGAPPASPSFAPSVTMGVSPALVDRELRCARILGRGARPPRRPRHVGTADRPRARVQRLPQVGVSLPCEACGEAAEPMIGSFGSVAAPSSGSGRRQWWPQPRRRAPSARTRRRARRP
jgi:hypothetical protein